MPGLCPEESPLPSRWEVSNLGATLVGAVGEGRKLATSRCREPTFEAPTPQTPGNICSRVADRCRIWGWMTFPGFIFGWPPKGLSGQGAPMRTPHSHLRLLQPRHPLYRVCRERPPAPARKNPAIFCPLPFGRDPRGPPRMRGAGPTHESPRLLG